MSATVINCVRSPFSFHWHSLLVVYLFYVVFFFATSFDFSFLMAPSVCFSIDLESEELDCKFIQ